MIPTQMFMHTNTQFTDSQSHNVCLQTLGFCLQAHQAYSRSWLLAQTMGMLFLSSPQHDKQMALQRQRQGASRACSSSHAETDSADQPLSLAVVRYIHPTTFCSSRMPALADVRGKCNISVIYNDHIWVHCHAASDSQQARPVRCRW